MSKEFSDPGHGNSPAAWTAVFIMLFAIAVGSVAFFFELIWVVYASVGVVIIGLIVGWVMARLGYGVNGSKLSPKGD